MTILATGTCPNCGATAQKVPVHVLLSDRTMDDFAVLECAACGRQWSQEIPPLHTVETRKEPSDRPWAPGREEGGE